MTVTLIWPGYCKLFLDFFRDIASEVNAARSSIESG